jgi:hypothetical protein
VWDGYRYEVLDEYVEEIDSEIGEVTSYSDMETLSGNFSNEYIEGTKYFSIKGVSTDEAINCMRSKISKDVGEADEKKIWQSRHLEKDY